MAGVAVGAVGGLIPARAGNTEHPYRLGCYVRAHPRSRGEHPGHPHRFRLTRGSSPLARGTRGTNQGETVATGLIPARAGNTPFGLGCKVSGGAHPRSRGEHFKASAHFAESAGSSPLARGTRLGWIRFRGDPGLIPARAGNTPGSWSRITQNRAHPRSRGEHRL